MIKPDFTVEQWAELLKKNKKGSALKTPFSKQIELIKYIFEPDENRIKQVDLCCGRGYGKSVLAIFIATMALSLSSNEIGLFLEPDWKRVRRVFLKKWFRLVPQELYEHNKTDQLITWKPTGSLLYYGPRNITGAHGVSDDSQLGQDTTFIIDDEAALRCSQNMYINNLATIREPSKVRFYLTLSTPRVGPYQQLVESKGHTLFRGISADNPYLPENYVQDLMAQMGPEQARRELSGEFITLEGRIWKTADMSQAWPNGNIDDDWPQFNPNEPWWLFCDLGGATGAYAVVQQSDAVYRGRELFRGSKWVAVADYCPDDDASASRAFQKLKEEFGFPLGVVAGADVNTRDRTDGRTVAYFVQQVFGSDIRIYPCNESKYNKQIQYDKLSYLMCSALGERRFTIARNFKSLADRTSRGIREMIDQDAWPPKEQIRPSDFLPKHPGNRVQHIRDALMMGAAMIMSPPEWRYSEDNAA